MATYRIKGITLQIGGDTTGLKKALSGVNKDISTTQGELKDVNRLLKLDPTNTELLRQKQALLSKAVGETKDKLSSLKTAESQAQEQFKKGKISQQQYDGLKREIIATESELKKLEKSASSSNTALSKISSVSSKVSGVSGKISSAMAPASAAIAGLGAVAFKAASDEVESQNKVDVAFGDSAKIVDQFANTAIKTYGIAKETALNMAAQFGDMATSMGLTQNQAATMSTTLVGLAGDLASFKNISTDEAMSALNGIFTGETKSLKTLGIVMTDNNLLQYAMANGYVNTAKSALEVEKEEIAVEKAQKSYNDAVSKYGTNSLEARDAQSALTDAQQKQETSAKGNLDTLSEAEKVQLRYNYVLSVTKNSHGDFARTSNGAANSLRIMQESAKEAASEFGLALLPVITPLIQDLTKLIQKFSSLSDSQKKSILTILAVIAVISPLAGAINGVSMAITFLCAHPLVALIIAIISLVVLIATKGDQIKGVLKSVDDFLQGIFLTDWTHIFGPGIGDTLNAFFATFKTIWSSILLTLNGVIDIIRGICTGDWDRVWKGFQEIFAGYWQGMLAIAKVPINGIIWLINGVISGIDEMISGLDRVSFKAPSWVPGFGGKSFGFSIPKIPNIPYLASGGLLSYGTAVVGEAGPELLTVSGGQALVRPLTASESIHSAPINFTANFYGEYTHSKGMEAVRDLNYQLGRLYT